MTAMTDAQYGPYGTAVPLRWQANYGRLANRTWLTQAAPPDVTWCTRTRAWWPVTVAGMRLHRLHALHGARALCDIHHH